MAQPAYLGDIAARLLGNAGAVMKRGNVIDVVSHTKDCREREGEAQCEEAGLETSNHQQ
jgi:hypothetical protein